MGTSLAAQWLRLRAPNAGVTGWIPSRGTKIPHATQHAPPLPAKKKKKSMCEMTKNMFYKDLFFTALYPVECVPCYVHVLK